MALVGHYRWWAWLIDISVLLVVMRCYSLDQDHFLNIFPTCMF